MHLVELGMESLDRVEDGAAGHRYAGGAAQHRPQGPHHPLLGREDPLHVPAERLRQREQAQRLGRGRAVDDDDVPLVGEGVQPQLEQGQHLLGTGDDRELLRGDRVHARDVQHRQEVALDLGPGLLEAQLGVDLVHEEPLGDLLRLRAHLSTERVGQRVRRVGGQHQGPVTGRRGQGRGAGGHGGLAHPALAGEEHDARRGHGSSGSGAWCGRVRGGRQERDSTRCLSPLSAVSIRIFSPLRFIRPIIGIATSRASRYVTSVVAGPTARST